MFSRFHSTGTETPRRGWILYDGRCPLCRASARRLGGIALRRGFGLQPLQRRWVRDLIAARDEPVADEMLLLLPDGRLLGGVAAYEHICRRVWWAWPIAALMIVPGVKPLLRRLYRWVARNRFAISRRCGLGTCRVR